MKSSKSSAAILILGVLTLVLLGWDSPEDKKVTDFEQNVIVLLKFKAQQDKGVQAVSELTDLFEKVKDEPNFVSIKLHVDPNDNTSIMLYEEWEDLSYYNAEHMNTAHLQAFMANSINFLTGPPEITFWEVKKVVK